MPYYTYKCNSCEEISEESRKMSERNDIVTCHHCKKGDLIKFITTTGIISEKGGNYIVRTN